MFRGLKTPFGGTFVLAPRCAIGLRSDEVNFVASVMLHRSRRFAGVLVVLPAALLLSDCGRKHQATRALPSAPSLGSGETGLARWYGHPYHGRAAAHGESYDMQKPTAGHR